MCDRMELVAWGLTTLVAAFVGSYLAGYLKKKGENLATHEDIGKLVEQMAAVTTATKEIEAKISNDVWERQRKWDVKREALFEALKALSSVEAALVHLMMIFGNSRSASDPNGEWWMAKKRNATDMWNRALPRFKEARILALLVCGQDLRNALEALEKSIIAMANETVSPAQQSPSPSLSFQAIREQINILIQLVRQELHVD